MRIAAIVVLALLLGLTTAGSFGWGVVLFFVPVILAVSIAVFSRRDAMSSAAIAGAAGFGLVVLFALLAYLVDRQPDLSADPDCDGLCFNRTASFMLRLYIASVIGFFVGLVSAILAAIVSLSARRASAR